MKFDQEIFSKILTLICVLIGSFLIFCAAYCKMNNLACGIAWDSNDSLITTVTLWLLCVLIFRSCIRLESKVSELEKGNYEITEL